LLSTLPFGACKHTRSLSQRLPNQVRRMHLSFFGSATMTSRSGLRVTGVVSGPLPLHLLVSMIWKAHLPFFWKTVQGSGVVFEETRNILFCSLAELWMMSLTSLETCCRAKRSLTERLSRLFSVVSVTPSAGGCWVVFASTVGVIWC
jgi:hypothetical protein